jgi:hypothetical protein
VLRLSGELAGFSRATVINSGDSFKVESVNGGARIELPADLDLTVPVSLKLE